MEKLRGRPRKIADKTAILLTLSQKQADEINKIASDRGTTRLDIIRQALEEFALKNPK